MATRKLLAHLAEAYERESGCRVGVTALGGVEAARRVQAGEPFDFAVLASGAIERLAAAGHVEPARADIARSGVAVAVAAGAARPDIGSEAALCDAVVSAARIGYSTGPSGDYLIQLFARWGIADAIASRLVRAQPGIPVGSLIASGEVQLGFQQTSELTDVPGIDIVGPLPAEVQLVTVFSAAVCAVSGRKEAARGFLAFATSARTDAIKRAYGMESARGESKL